MAQIIWAKISIYWFGKAKKAKMDEMDELGLVLSQYLCSVMNENENHIHIGQLIQAQLKADQRSVGWLAREIGCTRNHVYKIFNKPSLDSNLLFRISKAMHFNFFQYYTAAFLEALKSRTGEE